MRRRYAHPHRGWDAAVDLSAPQPAKHLARMVNQALRFGLPARRRFGRARALVARVGLPVPLAAQVLTFGERVDRPDLDVLLNETHEHWDELCARSERLPREPPALSVLAMTRRAGLTAFLFGEDEHPLLVLKYGDEGPRREAEALHAAEPVGVAPRYLGVVADAHVQEGLPGEPLRVSPIDPARAAAATMPPALEHTLRQITALAHESRAAARPDFEDYVERALAFDLEEPARRALEAAWRDLRELPSAVLMHDDTSPQNCMVLDGRLVGLIDWETARMEGVPGFDALNAVRGYFDSAMGLARWSDELMLEGYGAAWDAAPLWTTGRALAREAALAGGVPQSKLDALEILFFGSGIGERLANPGVHPTSPATEARLLASLSR